MKQVFPKWIVSLHNFMGYFSLFRVKPISPFFSLHRDHETVARQSRSRRWIKTRGQRFDPPPPTWMRRQRQTRHRWPAMKSILLVVPAAELLLVLALAIGGASVRALACAHSCGRWSPRPGSCPLPLPRPAETTAEVPLVLAPMACDQRLRLRPASSSHL